MQRPCRVSLEEVGTVGVLQVIFPLSVVTGPGTLNSEVTCFFMSECGLRVRVPWLSLILSDDAVLMQHGSWVRPYLHIRAHLWELGFHFIGNCYCPFI